MYSMLSFLIFLIFVAGYVLLFQWQKKHSHGPLDLTKTETPLIPQPKPLYKRMLIPLLVWGLILIIALLYVNH